MGKRKRLKGERGEQEKRRCGKGGEKGGYKERVRGRENESGKGRHNVK